MVRLWRGADTVKGTITGTLAWKGKDNYWTSDNRGLLLANHFSVDRTINFDASNSTIIVDPLSPCTAFKITIGYDGPQGILPAMDFYGPWFTATFDIDAKTVKNIQLYSIGSVEYEGFHTHPCNTPNPTFSFPRFYYRS
jgi:hypothetical protein